jgi:hypothetical protein
MSNDKSVNMILFEHFQKIIKKLPKTSILSRTKRDLDGYEMCILKGINSDSLPPLHIKGGAELYNWNAWKQCSLIISADVWGEEKFKSEALKKYNSISSQYLSQFQRINV